MSSMYGRNAATGSMQGAQTGGNRIPKGYESSQLQRFTPEQMQLFSSLFSNLGPDSFLGRLAGGDESAFSEMEAPALRQFAGIQGNLASKFSGMGTGGRHSSGFQNIMNQASSDFAQDLQAKRMGLRSQALKDLFGLSESLLQQMPYEQFLTKKERKPSFLEQIFGQGLFGNEGKNFENIMKLASMFI